MVPQFVCMLVAIHAVGEECARQPEPSLCCSRGINRAIRIQGIILREELVVALVKSHEQL